MEITVAGFVASVIASVVAGGLHTRLEKFLSEKQIKKVIAELEKHSHSNAIKSHMSGVYYNDLDKYVTEKDIVLLLIEICYDKSNPEFMPLKDFAEKETDCFIEQKQQYRSDKSTFVKIFEGLYNAVNLALNTLDDSGRKQANVVRESEYNVISKVENVKDGVDGLHYKIDVLAAQTLPQPQTQPNTPHNLTLQAPQPGKEFSYRDNMVEELHQALKQGHKLALISGLGGVGKTAVAKALYHRVKDKDEYKQIAWVEYQQSIANSLLNSFTLFNEIADSAERYKKIQRFLLNSTKDTIIFVDNVPEDAFDEAVFLERLPVNVVLTSRANSNGNFTIFPVDLLSEEQCIEIFYKYYKYDKDREQKESVRKLVNLVKCHTLSIELLAGAANRPNYPLEKYVSDLKEKGFKYPDLNVKTNHTAISKTIAQHLITLFEMVGVSDEQKRILKNFALMPSIEIPAEVESWIGCTINDLMRLVGLNWITAPETDYKMHPIVQEAIRLQYKKVEYEDFEQTIKYMSGKKYIKATDVYTHVHTRLNIAESIMGHLEDFENEKIALLFNNIGIVCDRQGNYPKALEWYHKALKICENVLKVEHPDTATSYNNIGTVYYRQGEYDKALEWYNKALEICEKVLGLEHPYTATSYNNVGGVYYRQCEYDKALEWYHKALKICENVLKVEHPDTATSYNNIGAVYYRQGEYDKALEWYHKALGICEKVLGLDHPDTARSYNNIAGIYDSQGDYPKALEWYRKDLEICEKILGLEHPDTATSYNNIGGVYYSQGDYPKALELYNKALAIKEKVLGLEHPSTATSYNNIGFVYDSQGDYPKALEWYNKALGIFEKVLGSEHPNTVTVKNNIYQATTLPTNEHLSPA